MNKLNATPRFLTALAVASALALAACGGGGDNDTTENVLPAGKVGTVGDGVNASEYNAIQCGMNKDQVQAIVGDLQTSISTDNAIWFYKYPTYSVSVWFPAGVVASKNNYKGAASVDSTKC
jgi:outer membrane protein assembly factor BamE (lipoprotein component of BamABCDE complex)